jgi:ATPase family associated with various cellular activities (AAA)
MTLSPTTLLDGAMVFDRTGQTLVAREPDAISVIRFDRDQTTRLPFQRARAIAAFDDQLWIATCDDQLVRVDPAGRLLAPAHALPFATRAALQPAPCGPAAAVWSSTPALALIDDFGQLAATALGDVDLALPFTGRRFVTARGAKLTLPSGIVTMLPPNSIVLGGSVMADGKSVTLVVGQAGGRQLIVVSLGTGQIVQCRAAPSSTMRLASRRGLIIAQIEPRVIRILDLQAARELGVVTFDHDVEDFAVDPDGQRLAVSTGAGARALHALAELLCRRSTCPAAPPSEASDAIAMLGATSQAAAVEHRTAEIIEPLATAEPGGPFVCPALTALDPRTRPTELDRIEARDQLEHELRTVALWTLGAIAAAWDSRRLGYGNEGRHPYELEVGAILGMNRGFAADYLAVARAQLAEHEAAIAGNARWRGLDTPVGALQHELGLDALALDVVVVIAAAALWGEIARLYGIVANDPGRATVDELLVHHVLEQRHDRHAIAAALDPRAPLVRLGIVRVAVRRARPFAELTVDPVVLDRLRAVEPELGSATTVRTVERDLAELDVPRDVLEAIVAALARPSSRADQHAIAARIAVHGRVGSGRRTLSCALAARAGRDLAVIDAHALPRTAELFAAELGRSLRRAQLVGMIPCVAHLGEITFDDRPARDLATEPLRLHPGPLVVISSPDEEVALGPGHISVELPGLAEVERGRVWRRALAEADVIVADVEVLAARYKIGPGVIRRAVEAARPADAAARGDASPTIEAYLRQTRDARLGHHARRVARLASWSNVVFPPDILDSLRELVARVRHGRQVYETWGMNRTMATSRGLTALFQGQPGTGKTLVAGVIARELGLDLYQVDLSKVMSKWIGETERNLSTIFDAAEDGQVILLFDEADSLFAKRTEVRSSNDRYANLEVNYLLQRLDAFEGIAILTTNIGNSIDPAFKRRLSFRLSFPFPDEETREQLWRAHLPAELPISGPLTLEALARKYQLSGGYIRNACLRAAFLAAQDETPLHQHHLERAVALEFAELGKLSSGGAID